MKAYYFISSFGLVEKSTSTDDRTIRELKSCGNYYESEKEALEALSVIKLALSRARRSIDMRNVRIGDWFLKGTQKVQITAENIASGMIITPIKLSEKVFRVNGYIEDGGGFTYESNGVGITASPLGEVWRVSVHTPEFVFAGHVSCIHEFQHILADCYLDSNISI